MLLTYLAYLACARHQADELHLEWSKGGGGNDERQGTMKVKVGMWMGEGGDEGGCKAGARDVLA